MTPGRLEVFEPQRLRKIRGRLVRMEGARFKEVRALPKMVDVLSEGCSVFVRWGSARVTGGWGWG